MNRILDPVAVAALKRKHGVEIRPRDVDNILMNDGIISFRDDAGKFISVKIPILNFPYDLIQTDYSNDSTLY